MAKYPELNRVTEQMSHAIRQRDFDAGLRALRDTQLLVGSAPLEHRQDVRDALASVEPLLLSSIVDALTGAVDAGDRSGAERLLSVLREAIGSVRSVSLRTDYRGRLRKFEDQVRDLPVDSAASPAEAEQRDAGLPTSASMPADAVVPDALPVADPEPERKPRPQPVPVATRPRNADPVLAARRAAIKIRHASRRESVRVLIGGQRASLPIMHGAYPFPGSLHGEDELERWLVRHGAPATRHGVIRLLAMAGLRLPTAAEFATMPRSERPGAPAWIRDDRHRLWLPGSRLPGFPREGTSRRIAIVVVSAAARPVGT